MERYEDMIKFNIDDFVRYCKENKDYYTGYCEIIIDPYGYIIPAIPSHTETVISYAAEKENKSKGEICDEISPFYSPLSWCIDKYGLLAVWHNGYIHGTYKRNQTNRFQRRTIDILKEHKLIRTDWINPTREYGLYLERKANGWE